MTAFDHDSTGSKVAAVICLVLFIPAGLLIARFGWSTVRSGQFRYTRGGQVIDGPAARVLGIVWLSFGVFVIVFVGGFTATVLRWIR